MAAVQTLIDASDISSDVAGDPIHVGQGEDIVISAEWTGASDPPTGTLSWQYSPDFTPERAASATWLALENGTFTTSPAGSAGSTAEVWDSLSGWVRPRYAAGSGGTSESLVMTAERNYRR